MSEQQEIDNNLYDKLKQVGIYKKYPQMTPFVGANYTKKKLLLVCESFYLSPDWAKYQKSDSWYKNDYRLLKENIPDALDWINMRSFNIYYDGKRNRPRPYAKLAQSIIKAKVWKELEVDVPEDKTKYEEQALSFCTSMNYFARPALYRSIGKRPSFELSDDDMIWSARTFWEVVSILDPNVICFASSKSYWNLRQAFDLDEMKKFKEQYDKYHNGEPKLFENVAHASSPWWNRANGMHGKNKFINFLQARYTNK